MDLLNLFRHTTDIESFGPGETIFEAGDAATKMYVVMEGEIEILVGDRSIERAVAGDILGEMALLADHRRTATAIAATPCRLTPINERRFLFLVQETPFFALHVMKVLVERIRRKEAAA